MFIISFSTLALVLLVKTYALSDISGKAIILKQKRNESIQISISISFVQHLFIFILHCIWRLSLITMRMTTLIFCFGAWEKIKEKKKNKSSMVNGIRNRHIQPNQFRLKQRWCNTEPYPWGHLSNELEYHWAPEKKKNWRVLKFIRHSAQTRPNQNRK